MKTPACSFARRSLHLCFLFTTLCGIWPGAAPLARAGFTLEMNVIRYHQYGYYFFPNLNTNNTAPSVPFGDYFVTSFGYPTNGSSALYHFDSNGFNQSGGGSYGYGDFDGMIHELTNRTWSIFVTNSVLTNVYYFTVTPNISSNDLPYVSITFPADGSVNVTNQPTFAWRGPTNYNNLVAYYFNSGDILPVTQTSLLSSRVLYQGLNSFTAHYDSNSTTAVVSSVPTNNAAQPISSWVSTSHLQDYSSSQFTVGTVDPAGTSHTLVAHYAWDGTNANGSVSGADTSGNSYHMNFGGSFGSQGGTNSTTDNAAGPRAIQFHNGNGSSAGYVGWNPTPAPLLAALARSFTISCWIKTTQNNFGWDQAPAYYGAGIVSADNGGLANDLIPLALTGSKIGFNTGGDVEDVTLNSSASVNDGSYHHIVVTRNQSTGQKIIYIDGVLDSFGSGTTNVLNDAQKLTLGALADASDPDPNNFNYSNGFDGLLDDLQIYTGVLSSNEVAILFANPGSTTPNSSGGHQNVAHYAFEDGTSTFQLGVDSSPNANNLSGYSYWGQVHTNSSDSIAGTNAVRFFGTSSINANDQVRTNLNAVLAGSFSFSAWVKTTASRGNDSDNAYFGATIFWAYNEQNNTNDTIPLAITGSKAAFTTRGGDSGASDTLHSTTSVNDGNYHLITVTRDHTTGEKKIYVDGNFEGSEIGTTNPLNGNDYFLSVGGSVYSSYTGLLDELQIYSGVLSASDVAYLSANPGSVIADVSSSDFNSALNTTGLTWTTGGNSNWFVETTNTHDSVSAAQSGAIGDNQESWIQTTVTGPGTLSFWWKVSSEDGGDYLEYDLDGNWQDDLTGDSGWQQQTYPLATGTHALRWFYYKDSCCPDGLDAGFLDQVSFAAAIPPTITLNPFNQTNYPGYNITLLAAATSSAAINWQWFKQNSSTVLIPGATNAFYVPADSGTPTAGAAYFAIASNSFGTATTAVALVIYQTAALPPDWSRAFRNQLYGNDNQQATTNYGLACLVDGSGNIYSANSFTGTNTFGSDTLISGGNQFSSGLFKHTATGNTLWGRGLTNSGNGNSYPQSLAPAPGDGVYMSGVFFGTNWLGTNKLVETAGGSVYLARFDANGSNLWVRTFGGTNACFQSYHQLISDPAGNVTVSALANNLVNFGTTNILLNGQRGLLVQYDANGNLRWLQQPSGWFTYLAYSAGRIYGSMGGNETNYSGGLTNTSDRQSVLVAMNATNGQALWLRGVASALGQSTLGDTPRVAVSGTNVFLVGSGAGSNAAFGPYSVSWPVSVGQYFARYDTNGTAQLATTFGSPTTLIWATVADASGNVYVGGDFDTYSFFGNKILAAPINDNIGTGFPSQTYVAKFDLNGNSLWARRAQSPLSYANLRDLTLVNDGVWSVGFVNQYAYFGTNYVSGTVTCIGFPFCTIGLHPGGWLAKITEGAAPPVPVTLLNPQTPGVNFQFEFLSQAGFTNAVQYRTNLLAGQNWQTYSNVVGDGTLKTIPIPRSVFSPAGQGFIRILTQ